MRIKKNTWLAVGWLLLLLLISFAGDLLSRRKILSEFEDGAGPIMSVYFLAVGQGDATLIRTPAGEDILIDGGPDNTLIKKLNRYLPINDWQIEYLILTHPDADHVNGLVEVAERYDIGTVIMTGVLDQTPAYLRLREIIESENIQQQFIEGPRRLLLVGGVELDFFYPQQRLVDQLIDDANNSSLVGRLIFASTSLMFTGDLEEEEKLLKLGLELESDIYKVGHHGSANANSGEFIRAVNPDYAVISVGLDNRYGHPDYRTLNNLQKIGAKIWRTDQDGDVAIYTDGRQIVHYP